MTTKLDADYGKGLTALGLNCTLKPSPETSNTEAHPVHAGWGSDSSRRVG